MKRLVALFGLVFAVLLPLWCSTPLSSSEKEELTQIIRELKKIQGEQETLIENSQKRNEEQQKLLNEQETQIEELKSLSENKQKTIDEQQQTINELESSLKEPKKSSFLMILNSIIAAIATFFGGFFVGRIFI